MRTIKFRGKQLNDYANGLSKKGDWLYGYLVINYRGVQLMATTMQDIKNNLMFDQWVPVIPETVGQFTGLKDKNGVEIYEGDIIKEVDERKSIVAWSDEWHGFNLIFDARPVEAFPLESNDCEVIGNIHEGEHNEQV